MEKIEKTENKIIFKTDIENSLANAIRRYVHQIPVAAVEEVEISKNDSPLYDETIAHRIGLIPLKMEKGFDEKSKGKLTLDVKKEGFVHSEELKGKPAVVYKTMPITSLGKGQELKLTAFVSTGKGAEHAKFSAGMMFYRNVSEVIMDKSLKEEISKACPEVSIKDKGDKIIVMDNGKKEIADICEGLAKKKGKPAEVNSKDELIVTVESFGQMDIQNIFKGSVDALKKDLSDISKQVSKA